jgi:benzoylsuccinyl-CoA thiolase BbsB subunit
MREVAIIGVGQTKFGKFPEKSPVDLGKEAVLASLKDANISPQYIQVAYSARMLQSGPIPTGVTCQSILKEAAIRGIEMVNVQNDCAGGSTAFRGVWKEIADGHYCCWCRIYEHLSCAER